MNDNYISWNLIKEFPTYTDALREIKSLRSDLQELRLEFLNIKTQFMNISEDFDNENLRKTIRDLSMLVESQQETIERLSSLGNSLSEGIRTGRYDDALEAWDDALEAWDEFDQQ